MPAVLSWRNPHKGLTLNPSDRIRERETGYPERQSTLIAADTLLVVALGVFGTCQGTGGKRRLLFATAPFRRLAVPGKGPAPQAWSRQATASQHRTRKHRARVSSLVLLPMCTGSCRSGAARVFPTTGNPQLPHRA